MKRSRFTDAQISNALKQHEVGIPIAEICRKMGVSEGPHYSWKKKYAGLAPSELQKLRTLEEENKKLKQLVAELTLDK